MIFNSDILFVHIPKTAGSSVEVKLKDALAQRPPVLSSVMFCSINKHWPLNHIAEHVLPNVKMRLDHFKRIIAVFRNPYAVEVSMWAFLGMKDYDEFGNRDPLREIAARSGFGDFLTNHSVYPSFEGFITVNGAIPPNVTILKVEDGLDAALDGLLTEYGYQTTQALPHANRSAHEPIESYYTPELEEVVFNKYRWVFDNGFYKRGEYQ